MIISLDQTLLPDSSDLPAPEPSWFEAYAILHPRGFARRSDHSDPPWSLTPRFHPYWLRQRIRAAIPLAQRHADWPETVSREVPDESRTVATSGLFLLHFSALTRSLGLAHTTFASHMSYSRLSLTTLVDPITGGCSDFPPLNHSLRSGSGQRPAVLYGALSCTRAKRVVQGRSSCGLERAVELYKKGWSLSTGHFTYVFSRRASLRSEK